MPLVTTIPHTKVAAHARQLSSHLVHMTNNDTTITNVSVFAEFIASVRDHGAADALTAELDAIEANFLATSWVDTFTVRDMLMMINAITSAYRDYVMLSAPDDLAAGDAYVASFDVTAADRDALSSFQRALNTEAARFTSVEGVRSVWNMTSDWHDEEGRARSILFSVPSECALMLSEYLITSDLADALTYVESIPTVADAALMPLDDLVAAVARSLTR